MSINDNLVEYNTKEFVYIRGGSRGGAHPAHAPPKIGKI